MNIMIYKHNNYDNYGLLIFFMHTSVRHEDVTVCSRIRFPC